MEKQAITKQALQRLPLYLNYLTGPDLKEQENISATSISEALNLNDVQVRKDLAIVSSGGRPKVGYNVKELIADLKHFLNYDNTSNAIIAGVGNLGRALLSYNGFKKYGLDIVTAFDVDESLIGSMVGDKIILPLTKLSDVCRRMKIHIGIITVPAEYAQEVCNLMIEGGITAIWNFAPVTLSVPEGVLVQNENMAVSLAVLSRHLKENMESNLTLNTGDLIN